MGIISRFWRAWAVEALFGRTTARQRTLFTALIGLSIAWPVLLFGILRPKLALQVLAFVPLPDAVPDWSVRVGWIALTFLIPLGMGLAAALESRPMPRGGLFVVRVLRGFPITVA